MKRHLVRSAFVLATVLAVLVAAAAPAAAQVSPFSFTFDDTYTDRSCGFPLEHHDLGRGSGRVFFDADGNFEAIHISNVGVATLTNLDNGLSVTQKFLSLFKNVNQVDNEDGTITLDQTVVGAGTLYGPNGEVLLREHGPITIHLTINPSAPDPADFIVSQEVVFEHGSHTDTETYCQIVNTALGLAS